MSAAVCLYGQQVSAIDSLERQSQKAEGETKARVLYELVYAWLRVDVTNAKQYADQANLLLTSDDPGVLMYASLAKGIFLSRTGQMDSAMLILQQADHHAIAAKNISARIKVKAALAHACITSGKATNGLEHLFEALKLIEQAPDVEMEFKLRTNIPWAYLELKQYENCIHYGRENLKLMEGKGYDWIALYTYNNVAVSYGALGNLDSARYFIDKGISAAEKTNDNQSLANGYFILGNIYAEAGKYKEAISQFLKARPYREKVGNPFFLVSDLYTVSELYYKSGEYHKGVTAGEEALRLAQQYDLTLKFEGTYLSLARNYEGLNDHKHASKYYRLYAQAKDSVYKNASAQSIAEMQTRYETEKKEQQLLVQRAELEKQEAYIERTNVILAALVVTLILTAVIFILLRGRMKRKQLILEKERELYIREVQIQASIQSQERERKRFAQDLHDGMGQLISALRLALHSVNNGTSLEDRVEVVSKAEGILNEMYKEIRTIAFNLMPQTLVQEGLVAALKEMSNRINGSGKIAVRVSSLDFPQRLTEVQEISLYRIIQEWVNNVVKYADATAIDIQLVGHEDELNITIEDNGNGFDTAALKNGSGNGWKNISSRLNLIKGTLDIESRAGIQGTFMMLRVPAPTNSTVETVAANTQQHG